MKNVSPESLSVLRARAAGIQRSAGPFRWEDGRLTEESRARLQQAMRARMRAARAVGGSLVLVRGDRTEIFCDGAARRKPCAPVTETTCFRLASVTKLILSFGFLSLAESGLLSLDADVSGYLGFPVRNPGWPESPVTGRMLLTHTAGIEDGAPYAAACEAENPPPLSDLLADPACWRGAEPGASFRYSNLGAGIAGAVMECASGMPLHRILSERVFRPLSIRAYGDPRLVRPASDLADGYRVSPLPFLPPRKAYDAARRSAGPLPDRPPGADYLAGAGRVVADSRGMAGILRLLASDRDTPVLSRASLREMRAPQDGKGGVRRAGRGLNVAFLPGVFPGFSPVGHQGVAYGMCSECFADPESGCGAAVMTSGMNLRRRLPPLTAGGFELLALAFAALGA